jgi:hypothetical protein
MRAATILLVAGLLTSAAAYAGSCTPSLLDPNLQVSVVIASGIAQPIGIVFLGADDFFVLEKASGRVKRVTSGVVQPSPVLDLAVNSSVERGPPTTRSTPREPRSGERSAPASRRSTPTATGTASGWRSIR